MRRCLIGDLAAAANLLSHHEPRLRPDLARRLIAEADAADRYRKRMGRLHPVWGNGSLMARALLCDNRAASAAGQTEFLAALAAVLAALLARRS